MPSVSPVLFLHAYVAAEAYAQSLAGTKTAPPPETGPFGAAFETRRSQFFREEEFRVPSVFNHPYRGVQITELSDHGIPLTIVNRLISLARETGRRYSVFRYENGLDPVTYEIREGTAERTDSTTFGGESFSQVEEDFFGTAFVAHIHPPGQSPFPSDRDLNLILEGARRNPGRRFIHVVYGFRQGEAIATVISSENP